MDKSIEWILLNADNISAFALLLVFIGAAAKQWIVFGWIHKECVKDRDEFKERVDALAKSNEEKLLRLELELEGLRTEHREHRARRSAT